MLHSYVKIWVHLIWTTKYRRKILHEDLRIKLFRHLIEKGREIDANIEKLNIQPEHAHVLLDLSSNKMIKDVAKNLKGDSSRWINENGLVRGRFKWQRGYGAFSVSSSHLAKVKAYIKNQEQHHKSMSFKQEWNTLL